MLVEGPKSVLGKRSRRAQLAGAKRRQRPPRASNIFCKSCKPLGQWQQAIEAHAFDLEAGIGRGTTRILKNRRDEPIIAGRKIACHVCVPFKSAWMSIPAACGRPWRR